MKVYQYVRFSSDEQKKGDSENRQVTKGQAWAIKHNQLIHKTYFDRGVSAYHGQNRISGEFAKMLLSVTSGDIILIENPDRFGRDAVLPAMNDLQAIAKRGIKTVFLDNEIEINESNFYNINVFLPILFQQLIGNEDNKKKAGRVGGSWKGKKKAAANKVILTRMAPAWLDVDRKNNIFTPNEKKAVVERIFNSYAVGKSIKMIARELNTEKVAPFGRAAQRKGTHWSSTSLRRLLSSRSVIGEYQPYNFISKKRREPDGEPISDYYTRIISNELFYKCQEIIRRNVSAGAKKTGSTNLFTGLVKCLHCGGAMCIKHSPKGKYFYTLLRCANAVRHAGCVHKETIQYSHVDRAVLTLLWTKIMPHMTEANQRADTLAASRSELQVVEAGLSRLMDAIEKVGLDETIANRIAKLKSDKVRLKSEIERLEVLEEQNPLLDWQPCAPTIENRLRMQNILRGEIESLTINAAMRCAVLTLKDPAVSFKMVWDYQKANATKKNPADSGFFATDVSGTGTLENDTYMAYQDELFVWQAPANEMIRVSVA